MCGDVLSNESMKPAHLKRHLTTKHALLKDKPIAFFERKLDELRQSKAMIMSCVTPVAKAQEASYCASLRISKTSSSDVADLANLLVYVRYEYDGASQEDFLFCQTLITRTTAEHIFLLLNTFMEENCLDWKKQRACPTLAPYRSKMVGKRKDIFSRLNDLNLGLQGLSITVFDVNDKINAMVKKLQLFEMKIKAGDVSAFPTLESFISENKLTLDDGVRDNIVAHIDSLRQQFRNYYPVSAEVNNWMRNPFTVEVGDMPEDFSTGK
ncbi:SCAN domain-containing protein 3 [Oopsacas minuta]|uniref:SCAN domain-containing protein 3 n=1 Tax=Oopsacas minuta TaxID=111878 RepID=A0AAV7JNQ8_9METZ|nr:SCAN domain-containing protein 3 [Oopsacas minuta]